ncbi:hypothetical protein [Kribbella sp. NBC_00359]|uniref:hypothetical protein n=1 Tax=Kribbella sp. NBC_00359 TaxID=2975966 RepID=UPI002E24AB16
MIKPGARADLSFVDGDPLADIRIVAAVDRVMVAGRLHTVDELLAPYAAGTWVQPAVHAANASQPLSRETSPRPRRRGSGGTSPGGCTERAARADDPLRSVRRRW